MNLNDRQVNPNLLAHIEELKKAINTISVYDFNVYTSMELYYNIANKLNEVITELSRYEGVVSEQVIEQNKALQYLLNAGLQMEVANKINLLLADGTLTSLLNDKVLKNINLKLNDKANKNEVRRNDTLITLNDCDSDLIGAISGNSSFTLESIPTDNSVENKKLTANLKRALLLDDYSTIEYEQGSLSGTDGTQLTSATRIRTKFLQFSQDIVITVNDGFQFKCLIYDENKNYLTSINDGLWKGKGSYNVTVDEKYFYRIIVSFLPDANITPVNNNGISIYGLLNKTTSKLQELENNINKFSEIAGVKPISYIPFEMGTISKGEAYESNNRIRTGFLQFSNNIVITPKDGFRFKVFEYDKSKNFIKALNNDKWITSSFTIDVTILNYYRLIVSYKNDMEINQYTQGLIYDGYINENILNIEKIKNNINNEVGIRSTGIDYLFNFKLESNYSENSYCSDICIANDKLIQFAVSDDEHINYVNSFIYDLNDNITFEKIITHNMGHMNTVSYNANNDCLIFGNGGTNFNVKGKFYVYPNFYEKLINGTTVFSIDDCIEYDCSSIELGNDYKFNVVWGDDNLGKNNMILLITNNHRNIYSIQLGKGTNNLGNGLLNSSATSSQFNGTFKIQKTYNQNTYNVTGTDNTYCVQGGQYFGNKLYTGVGHEEPEYWIMKFNRDGSITREEIIKYQYKDDGSKVKNNLGGIAITDKYIILCISNYLWIYNK